MHDTGNAMDRSARKSWENLRMAGWPHTAVFKLLGGWFAVMMCTVIFGVELWHWWMSDKQQEGHLSCKEPASVSPNVLCWDTMRSLKCNFRKEVWLGKKPSVCVIALTVIQQTLAEYWHCINNICCLLCVSDFENQFRFPTDLPPPEPFRPTNRSYPSKNPRNPANAKGLCEYCEVPVHSFWQVTTEHYPVT